MKKKLSAFEKYKPLWEGGKSESKYNIKAGYKIRMFCIQELSDLYHSNPELFDKKEVEEFSQMSTELKQEKSNISSLNLNCSLEDYKTFLQNFFQKIDYEDRYGVVTMKTTMRFRLMTCFIDVLQSWGEIDEEMKNLKKYCQYKAVDIYKALKKGEIPKRGGPKDFQSQIEDLPPEKDISQSTGNLSNLNLENNISEINNNNKIINENTINNSKETIGNNNEINELKSQLINEKEKNKKLEEIIKLLKHSLVNEKNKNKNLELEILNLKSNLNNAIEKQKSIVEDGTKTKKLGDELKSSYLETIIEKDKEIKELRLKLSRLPFTLEEEEKLMSIIFMSLDKKFIYSVICKNTDEFYKIEGQLYKSFPEYSEKEIFFSVNERKINKHKTLEENNIKNNDTIILNIIE